MDYLAYIDYKDKKTMAANQNLMIDALGFDLKKISIKDTYNEQAKKIEVLKEMWSCYRPPLFSTKTAVKLFNLHRIWKNNLVRQKKVEANASGFTSFDAELVYGPKYSKEQSPIVKTGDLTYMIDPHTCIPTYLCEYTGSMDLKHHATHVVIKGNVSGNLNLFLTVQKTLYYGLKKGFTHEQVAFLLLQILESEMPAYVELVRNVSPTPHEIFNNVLKCVRSSTDVASLKDKIRQVTRQKNTEIRTVINALQKLIKEYLFIAYPFESEEKREKKLNRYLENALLELVEEPTKLQVVALIEANNRTGHENSLEKSIEFVEQYENSGPGALQSSKSYSGKGIDGFKVMTNAAGDILPKSSPSMSPTKVFDVLSKTGKNPKNKKKGEKKRTRAKSPKPEEPKPKPAKKKDKKKKEKEPKTSNLNNAGDSGNANKTPVSGDPYCYICGTKCGNRSGKTGKCNMGCTLTDEKCGLCGHGHHKTSGQCATLFTKRVQQQKNVPGGR